MCPETLCINELSFIGIDYRSKKGKNYLSKSCHFAETLWSHYSMVKINRDHVSLMVPLIHVESI